MSTRIIVADHSELFARGVAELLGARGYEVLGIASTSEEAVALAADHPESLVLIDESIDGEGAPTLIRGLLDKNPRQPTIVLNGSWDLSQVVLGLGAGAVGVIDKSCTPEHLFAAIDIVTSGGMVFSSEAVETLRDQLTEVFDLVAQRNMRRLALTEREIELLPLLHTSMTLQQIAAKLFVSRKTIQNNASSLYRKLGAASRPEAVARAIELGLISSSPARANTSELAVAAAAPRRSREPSRARGPCDRPHGGRSPQLPSARRDSVPPWTPTGLTGFVYPVKENGVPARGRFQLWAEPAVRACVPQGRAARARPEGPAEAALPEDHQGGRGHG